MTPEEWPIAASAAPVDAPACPAGSGRLRTVRADFFLDPAERLTEQERAVMTAMMHCLIADAVGALRAGVPGEWCGVDDEDHLTVTRRLAKARLLDHPDLIGLLLQRADEERIGVAARARSGRSEPRVLQGLVSHHGAEVAASAMGLIIARGRRRDRFGQCLVLFDDLTPAAAHALVHGVAGALRGDLARRYGPVAVDRELGRAANELSQAHDPDHSEDALTAALVDAVHDAQAAEDSLILSAAVEGEVRFVAHMLARRAGLFPRCAADELLSGDPSRLSALFRVAGVPRTLFASLLASVGDVFGIADPARAIAMFDAMPEAEVEAARSWLAAAPQYRQAVSALELVDGQRSL